MDEIIRNLAPPLGAGLLTLVMYVWARGLHRRTAERSRRRREHPAE
jgi:hypothetical protein